MKNDILIKLVYVPVEFCAESEAFPNHHLVLKAFHKDVGLFLLVLLFLH